MSVALALGLGFFVLTAVAAVLGVGLVSGYQNTIGLLKEKAELLVSSERTQTRRFLTAAEDQAEYIARQIASGEIDPGADESFVSLLLGALAATPQIVALQFVDTEYQLVGAERLEFDTSPIFLSVRDDPDHSQLLERAQTGGVPFWGPVLWRHEYRQPLLVFQHPVIRDGRFVGAVSAFVSLLQLSEFISDLESEFGANAFILYGRDQILAHPLLAFGYPGTTRLNPLPRQTSFGDPIISAIWLENPSPSWEEWLIAEPGIEFVQLGEQGYVVLYRELLDYADRPLLVGTYFRSQDVLAEVFRLKWAIVGSLAVALVAAVAAGYIGRQIAQPVRRLADGAKKIYDLDLAHVERMPASFFSELKDASRSFNTMLDGLRWFERYVPKALVRQLIHIQPDAAVESAFRDVVVMFTDIVAFTAMSERMSAPDTADLLNQHFTMVSECVGAEGGIVDKYIGDSVMAIWGALEVYPDAEDRACRAALAIRRAIAAHNRTGQAGQPVIDLRIGIHVGKVMVGNIGSPERLNYTVVGDAVNVAQRLQELGDRAGDSEGWVKVLLSAAVKDGLLARYQLTELGARQLRGRSERVEVYALRGGLDPTLDEPTSPTELV
jgi:class 3 adenylate cyclase